MANSMGMKPLRPSATSPKWGGKAWIKVVLFLLVRFFEINSSWMFYLTLKINYKQMKSKLFTLDRRDLINGLLVAFLTAVLTGIIQILGEGAVFTWVTLKPVLIAGISAACAYLIKNFSTNSRNQLLTKEPE